MNGISSSKQFTLNRALEIVEKPQAYVHSLRSMLAFVAEAENSYNIHSFIHATFSSRLSFIKSSRSEGLDGISLDPLTSFHYKSPELLRFRRKVIWMSHSVERKLLSPLIKNCVIFRKKKLEKDKQTTEASFLHLSFTSDFYEWSENKT